MGETFVVIASATLDFQKQLCALTCVSNLPLPFFGVAGASLLILIETSRLLELTCGPSFIKLDEVQFVVLSEAPFGFLKILLQLK